MIKILKNIKTFGNNFDKISFYVALILLISTALTPDLGNILSKMFNTF